MTWTEPAFAALAELVSGRTGLRFPEERREQAELAMRRSMACVGVADAQRYQELVQNAENSSAFDDLVAELTIGETYFFRLPEQFDFIRCRVLPELGRARGPAHMLRVWSAGCASGEEAYSLAMLLTQEGLAERSYLVASDISRTALARANKALYSPWSLRGLAAELPRPYLEHHGDGHRVCESIRRAVSFRYLNLAMDVYPSFASGIWGMDLILC